ncbi:MAG TPA: DNA-processing protein DprA [Blastocatellia bacterium]|nr:DNA-processing protein DprA [Blastocatellia bacterium]
MSSSAPAKSTIDHVLESDPRYPRSLSVLGDRAPASLALLGNVDLLGEHALALFCSVRCPGSLILKTYDLAQKLRENGVTVIGGFHSPVERECLNVLLKSSNKVIICPARGLESMRIPADYRKPLEDGRLLLVSPFTDKQRQANSDMAERRNRLVGAMADRIFVAYAAPRSKTERLCREMVRWGKLLYTFAGEYNSNLITLGAGEIDACFSLLAGPVSTNPC